MKRKLTIETSKFEKIVGIIICLLVAVSVLLTYLALRQWRTTGYTRTIIAITVPIKQKLAIDFRPLASKSNNLITRIYVGYLCKEDHWNNRDFLLNIYDRQQKKIATIKGMAQKNKAMSLRFLSGDTSSSSYVVKMFIPFTEIIFLEKGENNWFRPEKYQIQYMPGECFTIEPSMLHETTPLCMVVEILGNYDPDDFNEMWTTLLNSEPDAIISWCSYDQVKCFSPSSSEITSSKPNL